MTITNKFVAVFFSSLFKRHKIVSFEQKGNIIEVCLYKYRPNKFNEPIKAQIEKSFKNSSFQIKYV